MRKRELRPFTIEVKSKRRSVSSPPASIWGDTEKLFKAPPNQASGPVFPKIDGAIVASAPAAREPMGEAQARRILPDLRAAQIEVAEDAVAIRVEQRRTRKSEHILRDEGYSKRRKKAVASAPVAEDELTNKKRPEDALDGIPAAATSSSIEVAPDPHPTISRSPIIVPQMSPRRDRKWVRGVDELPRGEKWKRRLPEVCR